MQRRNVLRALNDEERAALYAEAWDYCKAASMQQPARSMAASRELGMGMIALPVLMQTLDTEERVAALGAMTKQRRQKVGLRGGSHFWASHRPQSPFRTVPHEHAPPSEGSA